VAGPYRSDHGAHAASAEAPRDQGIVGDVIAQFADPLAFYRELVQNSIDAGSPTVEVRLEYDEAAGVLRVQVRDRGEGMTRDILENQLLVLFRSTKEKDDSKIGKFGIGFSSVLAPNPQVVVVQTSRDSRRLVLHLSRDLTYQLYDGGPATQSGTTVELELAMKAGEVEAFADKSVAALKRWCRHASVPVTFSAQVPGRAEPIAAKIDSPLALDHALVEVRATSSDRKLSCVVGLGAGAPAYTGFFNHGLMLHETTEPLLGRVCVKLQDARLGHTLSRDDVRRDAAFERALAFARTVIERDLPQAAQVALRTAAEAGDRDRWWKLATALLEARIELDEKWWWFPLLPGGGQAHGIAAPRLGKRAWVGATWSPLAARVVETGQHLLEAEVGARRENLKAIVKAIADCQLFDLETELTAITPIPALDEDVALLAMMRELLARAHRAPPQIVLAQFEGRYADVLALPCTGDQPHVIDNDQATRKLFGRRPPPLALSAAHHFYRSARALDPRAGASLLVRILLLNTELLDVSRSTLLLEDLLDRIGVRIGVGT
jgi:molecular chaperone HtpG